MAYRVAAAGLCPQAPLAGAEVLIVIASVCVISVASSAAKLGHEHKVGDYTWVFNTKFLFLLF